MDPKEENPFEPKIEDLNTACERITYAMDRIGKQGWIQCGLRNRKVTPETDRLRVDVPGPACLLGSLVTDAEYATFLHYDVTGSEMVDDRTVYKGTLPGLMEACTALDFSYVNKIWEWNDEKGRTVTDVLLRLAAGKTRACS